MKAGSLFAGIGGFDLGLERAGVDVAWQVELDKSARGVLERHWPTGRRFMDVREVGVGNLEPVDLVCGGFPCQDLSVAGRRAGLGGERSGLWWEFHRIVSELRPRWVVAENVPGLLSSNGGRDMGAILGSLGKLGYGVAYRILDARFFGLAQRRRRVLIVGCLGDGRRAAQVLLEPEGGGRDSPSSGAERADVAGTLGSKLGGSRTTDLDGHGAYIATGGFSANQGGTVVASALTAPGGKGAGSDATTTLVVADSLRASSGKSTSSNAQLVAYDRANVTSAGNRSNPQPGDPCHTLHGEAPLLAATLSSGGHPGSNAPGRRREDDENLVAYQQHGSDVGVMGALRRGHGDVQSGVPFLADPICANEQRTTSHAGNNPRPRNVVAGAVGGVRRLTPTECERLQGFPDGWTAEGSSGPQSDSARYRQLGNAFPPPMAEWVARRIADSA